MTKTRKSGRLCQQNAASPRIQVFKLRKSFALHCVGHPTFLYLHRRTESHHRNLSPASHLPQQSTNQRCRGDQRTHSYLANDTPRAER